MSGLDRGSIKDGLYYKNDAGRDSGGRKDKKRNLSGKEFGEKDYYKYKRPCKNLLGDDYKERSSDSRSCDRYYSVSSDSGSDGSFTQGRKGGSAVDDSSRARRIATSSKPKAGPRKDDVSEADSEDDFSSARKLNQKTKMILSKLGWTSQNMPDVALGSSNVKKVDAKSLQKSNIVEVVDDDDDDDRVRDSALSRSEHSWKAPKGSMVYQRDLQTDGLCFDRSKKFRSEDFVDGNDVRRVKFKAAYKEFSESDGSADGNHGTSVARSMENVKYTEEEDQNILMNIRSCRNTMEHSRHGGNVRGFETGAQQHYSGGEEVRNVKLQPQRVKTNSAKRFKTSTNSQEETAFGGETAPRSNSKDPECERRKITIKAQTRSRQRSQSGSSDERSESSRFSVKRKHSGSSEESCDKRDKKYNANEKRRDARCDQEICDNLKSTRMKTKACAMEPATDILKRNSEGRIERKTCYDYFDKGSHRCKECCVVYEDAVDFLKHLHTDPHQKFIRNIPKPWTTDKIYREEPGRPPSGNRTSVPLKGLEFMVGTWAYYCKLCRELVPDIRLAEKHVKGEGHNEKYREFKEECHDHLKRRQEKVGTDTALHVIPDPKSDGKMEEEIPENNKEEDSVVEPKCFGRIPSESLFEHSVPKEAVKVATETIPKDEKPQQISPSKEQPVSEVSFTKEETADVKEDVCVVEFKPKPERVTLDLKAAISLNASRNPMIGSLTNSFKEKETTNSSTSSAHLAGKKLPFIGKRPSKLSSNKNEVDPNKPQTTVAPNAASLSREELLSRVMKDTIIVPPKDIRITPLGVSPDAYRAGYMGSYMPLMAPYMAYPHYGAAYYDMSMYYDPSHYLSGAYETQSVAGAQAAAECQSGVAVGNESITDMDTEDNRDAISQDHYENYTIGCDDTTFGSTEAAEVSDVIECKPVHDFQDISGTPGTVQWSQKSSDCSLADEVNENHTGIQTAQDEGNCKG